MCLSFKSIQNQVQVYTFWTGLKVQTMLCKYSYKQNIHQKHAGVEGFWQKCAVSSGKKNCILLHYVKSEDPWFITLPFLSSMSRPWLWSWFLSSLSYSLPRFSPPPCALPARDSSWVQRQSPALLVCTSPGSNQLITASKRAPVSQQPLPDRLIGHGGHISGSSLHRVSYLIFLGEPSVILVSSLLVLLQMWDLTWAPARQNTPCYSSVRVVLLHEPPSPSQSLAWVLFTALHHYFIYTLNKFALNWTEHFTSNQIAGHSFV